MTVRPLSAMKLLRLERGLNRYEVAARLGVNDRTLGNWEKGRGAPDLAVAQRLADLYGVTLDKLAGRSPASA